MSTSICYALISSDICDLSVDESISVVFEFKSWWWFSDINSFILHVVLVHLTMLFVTELFPIVIGIDYTFGSKVRIHYCKLRWIFIVGSTPSLYRTATSSSGSTLAYMVAKS